MSNRLDLPCPRDCGRKIGAHKLPFHLDDCTWTNDALSMTYDDAEYRYSKGLWSLDQWEAFRRIHTYSSHRSWHTPLPEVEHYMNLIAREITRRAQSEVTGS